MREKERENEREKEREIEYEINSVQGFHSGKKINLRTLTYKYDRWHMCSI